MRVFFLCCLVVASLSGCATGYHPDSALARLSNHGFEPERSAGNLVVIHFTGNRYTTEQLAADYVVYRSAELAKAKGKPYFALYRTLEEASREHSSHRPYVGTNESFPLVTAYVRFADADEPGTRSTETVLAELSHVGAGFLGRAK